MGITHGWTSAETPDGSDVTPTNFNNHTIANDTVTEAQLSISDNTTKNVSTSAHGFAPKGDGDTAKFLNANGAYSTPAASPLLSFTAFRSSGGSTITMYAQGPLADGNVMFMAVSTVQYNVSSIAQTGVTWTLVDKGDVASGNQQHTELWKGAIGSGAKNKIVVTMAGSNTAGAVAAEFNLTGTVGSNGNATHASGADCTSSSITSSAGNVLVVALGYRGGTGEPCGVYGGPMGLSGGVATNQIGVPANLAWMVSTGAAVTVGIQDTGDNMAMAWAVVTA